MIENPPDSDSGPLRGLVLAGGRSSRMGVDKASLEIAGRSQLDQAVQTMRGCVAEVFVSVRDGQQHDVVRASYPCIVDRFADLGPAAGILSAHLVEPDAAWLVVACDMPMLDAATLRCLVRARRPQLAATAFRRPGTEQPEPLCAIYEPATLARFLRLTEQGFAGGPRDFLAGAETYLLTAPDEHLLENVNTPADFTRIKQRFSRDPL